MHSFLINKHHYKEVLKLGLDKALHVAITNSEKLNFIANFKLIVYFKYYY